MVDDYDTLSLPGNGELFLGNSRSASYQFNPAISYYEICLCWKDDRGEHKHEGESGQSEKARDVCRIWMEQGVVAKSMERKRNG